LKGYGTGPLVAVLALLLASVSAVATPRLQAFYDVATATRAELRRVNATNSAILGVRIGDTLEYLQHRLGRPHGVTIKDKGTPGEHRVLRYDDLDVRVDADRRISRIRVMASGAWIMRNGLRDLLSDFSERRMRQLLGWNYRRKLKRVYVWPIDRRHFVQDQDHERLVKNVQQYYGFRTRQQAEKKIIRAWDTTYVYSERGIRVRVYSNVPVSGRFKADFVLVKPAPSTPPVPQRSSPPPHARR
jgi:hypothetical protein